MDEKKAPEQVSVNEVVRAFVMQYSPCFDEGKADECFTIGRLRETFCAWVMFNSGADDPLIPYMDALRANGYTPTMTVGSGPAILVNYK